MRANSADGERKYSRRTGTFANRSRTTTRVPGGPADGRGAPTSSACASIAVATSASAVRETIVNCATAAMDASPSPRKPSVSTCVSPEAFAIFEVA